MKYSKIDLGSNLTPVQEGLLAPVVFDILSRFQNRGILG